MNLKEEYKLAVLEKVKSEIRAIEEKIQEAGKLVDVGDNFILFVTESKDVGDIFEMFLIVGNIFRIHQLPDRLVV